VSGAGPTVLAFGAADTSALTAACPDGWACHDLAIEPSGAVLLT
jgi:homoserine kinase